MRSALAFLTAVGRARRPDPAALRWFGPVGLAVGAVVGGLWWGAERMLPALVAAGLVVAADLALTGMLHLDGLADSGDGLLAPMPRQRRLDVMRQPDVGAFGVAVVLVVLGLRWSALASQPARPMLVAGLWAGSRATMCAAMWALPYARSAGGLATSFLDRRPAARGALLGGALAVAASATCGRVGWSALAGLAVGAGSVLALARRRLGGYTGDVLGAAGLVGETVGLVVASSWSV